MRIHFLLGIVSFLIVHGIKAQDEAIPIPTPAQLAWQNAELTVIFHYDLHVFDGEKYNQRRNRITPIADYNIFNPNQLDTDQWAKAAKEMGAKIAILTATHETGFALYQSDVNPYSLKALKWRDGQGDIVKDFVASCRKYGIKPGIYIGIRWNSFYGIYDFKVAGDDKFAQNRQDHYNRMCEGMVNELTSNYGELAIVWFDGGAHGPKQGGPDVQKIVEQNQPNTIFYHNLDRSDIRWGGSESGIVPYPCWGTYHTPSWFANRGDSIDFKPIKYGDPNGNYYMPAMSDAPLRGYNGRHEWFWEPGDEKHIYPLHDLVNMYYNSVGHNSTLILGITPNPEGLVPEADRKRMQELGNWISQTFSEPIAEYSGGDKPFAIELDTPQHINTIVLEEDISFGERVRNFSLVAEIDGKKEVIYEGTSIGHKHIVRLDRMKVRSIKLKIKNSIRSPQIKSMNVYDLTTEKITH